MPTHVYANTNEIASKASDGKAIAALPNVCFSPPAPPVGPLPLPYLNTGECTNTDNGTSKIFIKDKMSGMAGNSYFSKSMGDEGATQNFNMGMLTKAIQGKCYFTQWSLDVKMEGCGVPRHMDMISHNHASQPGNACSICMIMKGCETRGSLIVSAPTKDIEDEEVSIGIFFDGTYCDNKCDSEKYHTNISILFCAYCKAKDSATNKPIFRIYVRGVGIDDKGETYSPGGIWGAGFEEGGLKRRNSISYCVASICCKIKNYNSCKIKFDLFGFSRGAANVRHVANDIVKNALPSHLGFFTGTSSPYIRKLQNKINKENVSVRFVGLFDTVSKLLGNSVDYSINSAIKQSYFQILADNEYRENFIREKINDSSLEISLPGSHSDIGGGYLPGNASTYYELVYIGEAMYTTKLGVYFIHVLDSEVKKIFEDYCWEIVKNKKKFGIPGEYLLNPRKKNGLVKYSRSVLKHGITLHVQDSKYDFMSVKFYAVRAPSNSIQKRSCAEMYKRARSKFVPLQYETIKDHLLVSDDKVTCNYLDANIHISSIGDDVYYGNMYVKSKNSDKIVIREAGIAFFPKVRVGFDDEYVLTYNPHKIKKVEF